jgi:hypothetical protein
MMIGILESKNYVNNGEKFCASRHYYFTDYKI